MTTLSFKDFIPIFHFIFLFMVGLILAKFLSRSARKLLATRLTPHQLMLLQKTVFYFVVLLFFLIALQQLGFSLSVLLGATGIITVAIGFAAQTSVANLISGLFMLAERPFTVGDTIVVNGVTGEVLSIDILSIKLRASDNTLVRIPNETLIKANMVNLSWFPNRRLDIPLQVAYKEDLEQVKKVLLEAAKSNAYSLREPNPTITLQGFAENAVLLQLSVWCRREDLTPLKNLLIMAVQETFKQHAIAQSNPNPLVLLRGRTQGTEE